MDSAECFEDLTWKQKRELIEEVFNGTTADGNPMGVYIEAVPGQSDNIRKQWRFKLRGNAALDGCWGRTPSMTNDVCP